MGIVVPGGGLMARKTAVVSISEEGRDKGKMFLLTEMPASQAEKWAGRALLLAAQAGADIGNLNAGMAGIATMGIHSIMGGVRFADIEPLLDEMFRCVQLLPNPSNLAVVRPLIEDDIEEVMTRVHLRSEVLDLHLGFSLAGAILKLRQTTPAPPPLGSPSIETSPMPLAP